MILNVALQIKFMVCCYLVRGWTADDLFRCHLQKMGRCLQQLLQFPCVVSFALVAFDVKSTDVDVLGVLLNAEDGIAYAKQHLIGVDLVAERAELKRWRRMRMLLGAM